VFVGRKVRRRVRADDLPPLIAADQKLLWVNERDTEANWKIVLEGFIEGYHIKATHPETFYPYGFDNLNVVETFGAIAA
jgi:phenylpropionate dioxygenase-like ring-hydroxylating dioxygenase large terminal subunit